MPKFSCQCGNVINLSVIPNPNEYAFISELKIDEFMSSYEEGKLSLDDRLDLLLEGAIRTIFCKQCGRFHLEREDGFYNTYSSP